MLKLGKKRESRPGAYIRFQKMACFLLTSDFVTRSGALVYLLCQISQKISREVATGEFAQCLAIARGSVGEVKSQLYVAVDQEYLNKNTFDQLFMLAAEISKMIGGLMHYMRQSKLKGIKCKK